MTAKEIIYETLKLNEKFNTIKLNTITGKVELNGDNILSVDYDDILDECKKEYPDTKFTKQTIKDIVTKYARENKYTPEKNEYHRSDKSEWYAQLEFDEDDKPKKTLNNIICFFKIIIYSVMKLN